MVPLLRPAMPTTLARLALFGLVLPAAQIVTLLGCSSSNTDGGCSSDDDCKLNRICVQGACQFPPGESQDGGTVTGHDATTGLDSGREAGSPSKGDASSSAVDSSAPRGDASSPTRDASSPAVDASGYAVLPIPDAGALNAVWEGEGATGSLLLPLFVSPRCFVEPYGEAYFVQFPQGSGPMGTFSICANEATSPCYQLNLGTAPAYERESFEGGTFTLSAFGSDGIAHGQMSTSEGIVRLAVKNCGSAP